MRAIHVPETMRYKQKQKITQNDRKSECLSSASPIDILVSSTMANVGIKIRLRLHFVVFFRSHKLYSWIGWMFDWVCLLVH